MAQRRRKQDRDEESDGNSAGKVIAGVAVGVAVAAGAAAISYFGSKFLKSWLGDEDEKEQGAVGGADDKPKSPAKTVDDSDSEDDSRGRKTTTKKSVPAASQVPPAAASQSLSLHDQLLEYYDNYVDIPAATMQDAQRIVDRIKTAVNYQLREPKSKKSAIFKIGELVTYGSTTEGLMVIRPDSFNVMIPVKFEIGCSVRDTGASAAQFPGFVYILLEQSSDESEAQSPSALCDGDGRLVARNLLACFRETVQNACSSFPYRIQISLNDWALRLTVSQSNQSPAMTIDFTPAVIIDNQLLLPWQNCTRAPECEVSDVNGLLWHTSYSRQEKWSVDRFPSSISGHLVCLKILQAIRLNHPDQFGMLSSYHCKTILFHVLEDLPDNCDWDKGVVGERLIDLLIHLKEALTDHNLPHYFEHNVNLLACVPEHACDNLAKFIEKKLAYNDIAILLKRDY